MDPLSAAGIPQIATYQRTVRASLVRVWENVHDWEHLPWIHRASFADIECLDAGVWGWRARVELQPAGSGAHSEIELRVEGEDHYAVRTLTGSGKGTEIWTFLTRRTDHETDVRVGFHVPGLTDPQADALGHAYTKLYRRLWDEDEAMMREREQALARRRSEPLPAMILLGSLAELRPRLPLSVQAAGRGYRVVEVDGELVAHSTLCPHLFGPLGEAAIDGGTLRCPWHGYRFDLRTGASCDGHRLRLPRAPQVEIDADSQVSLCFGKVATP